MTKNVIRGIISRYAYESGDFSMAGRLARSMLFNKNTQKFATLRMTR